MTANWRQIGLEFARAFAVLALVWLNFGHAPPALKRAEFALLPDGSVPVFCGQLPAGDPDGAGSQQCDACRLTAGLDLPASPVPAVQPAVYVHLALARPAAQSPLGGPAQIAARPRAPPVSA